MTATYDVISTQTTTGEVTTVVFNSIPATFTDLILLGTCRMGISGGDDVGLRFNGDTNNNYNWQQITQTSIANPITNFERPANYARCINNLDGSQDTGFEINIFNYANTSSMKNMLSRWSSKQNTIMYFGTFGAGWFSNNAINSITFMKPNGGAFAAGSVFTLIGIKAE